MSVLGVYANAEKIILAHATSKTRSLRAEVIAAIDAKDAAVAAGGENGRPKVAQRITKVNPTAMKCPELRKRIVNDDEFALTFAANMQGGRLLQELGPTLQPVPHGGWR